MTENLRYKFKIKIKTKLVYWSVLKEIGSGKGISLRQIYCR